MDDMTLVPVVLPAHTLDDLLRMCANVENDYGYQPVFIRVIRDRVAEAVERVKTLEAIAKVYGPDLVEHVLKRDGVQCRTMLSQRPCGTPSCTRVECSRRDQTLGHYTPQRPR